MKRILSRILCSFLFAGSAFAGYNVSTTPAEFQASNEVLQAGIDSVAVLTTLNTTDIDRNENNIFINAFRVAVNGSLSAYNMVDGFVDDYQDEVGIATGEGANFFFDAGVNGYQFLDASGNFTTNLVLLLKCDENAANTTVVDSSGQGNNGVSIRNTSLMNATGKVGDGFDLVSASLDDVTITALGQDFHKGFGTTSVTYSYWVAWDNWTATDNVFHRSQRNASPQPMTIAGHYQTAVVTMRMADDNNDQVNLTPTEPLSFINGSFHHIIYEWDASTKTLTIYMDGVQVITGINASVDDFANWEASQGTTFGARNRNGNKSLHGDGIIDAIYVWSRAITATERIGLFNLGAGTESTTYSVGGPLEMRSVASTFTATTEPTEVRLVFLMEPENSFTLNTDFEAFASKDDGSTWDKLVIVDEGVFSGDIRIFSATNLLTSAGTAMRYKYETQNGAGGFIFGSALLWK